MTCPADVPPTYFWVFLCLFLITICGVLIALVVFMWLAWRDR